jgi:transcriptional regulator with XRE-family HTH domain
MFVQLKDYPDYMVDECGVVVSLKKGEWRVRKQGSSGNGYRIVALYERGKTSNKSIHSLVMAAFIGPRPPGLVINHKNGIKTDNRLENLEYVTQAQNDQHSRDTGLTNSYGENNGSAKLSDTQAAQLLAFRGTMLLREAAAQFGVSQTLVNHIWNGRTRQHLQPDGFEFVPPGKCKGEDNKMAKLTNAQALELLGLRGKMLQREAAVQFNISRATVSKIWLGTSHKYLQPVKEPSND